MNSERLREWRHNPCLMRPLSALLLIVFAAFWLVVTVLKFPTLVLGLLLSPILQRFNWVIEFWYPTAVGKWMHLTLVRLSQRSSRSSKNHPNAAGEHADVNRGFHSRSTETRIEIVRDRVYVHPLPQLLDNLGYLVVCLPSKEKNGSHTENNNSPKVLLADEHQPIIKVEPLANATETKIVAFVVDCGDADAVAKHVKIIRKTYYGKKTIHVQSVLSTHKHHDHTAGNKDILLHHPDFRTDPVKLIFGGAVDKVPYCNFPLANGDKLPLPRAGENNMADVVEVEAVATPAHTRGSLTYVLRALPPSTNSIVDGTSGSSSEPVVCLFTGDTMFSAGGGVPFEADIDPDQDQKASKMTANSYIKASAANNAVERCFAEVLYRSAPPARGTPSESILVFPGHEYTNELLSRQLSSGAHQESCRWRNFAPAVFFETMSQAYIAMHRRTLPHSSGRLLNVPSSLQRELYINPQLRSLKQRGGVLIVAIRLWNRNFAKHKVAEVTGPAFPHFATSTSETAQTRTKKRATETQWNMDVADCNRKVFTTVYADDLDAVIRELDAGKLDPAAAARRLEELKTALDKNVIGRRPIPGTLPSSKAVYRGLLAFALLGSSPTAATRSDSLVMKMPEPMDGASSSDRIRISKKRLTTVLHRLGLCDGDDGQMVVRILHQLWKETHEYCAQVSATDRLLKNHQQQGDDIEMEGATDSKNDSTDAESMPDPDDEVELGALKWVVYGIPERPKPSWFAFCTPCFNSRRQNDDMPSKKHLAGKLGMNRHGGELVRHDVFACPLCRNATGCPNLLEVTEEVDLGTERSASLHTISSSSHVPITAFSGHKNSDDDGGGDGDDDDDSDESSGAFIEVTPLGIGSVLQEF